MRSLIRAATSTTGHQWANAVTNATPLKQQTDREARVQNVYRSWRTHRVAGGCRRHLLGHLFVPNGKPRGGSCCRAEGEGENGREGRSTQTERECVPYRSVLACLRVRAHTLRRVYGCTHYMGVVVCASFIPLTITHARAFDNTALARQQEEKLQAFLDGKHRPEGNFLFSATGKSRNKRARRRRQKNTKAKQD